MPAGVHHPRRPGGIRHFAFLLDRKGIHVSPDGNEGRALASLADDASATYPGLHPVAQGPKHFCDKDSRPGLLESQLGIHVNLPAPAHQLLLDPVRTFQHTYHPI